MSAPTHTARLSPLQPPTVWTIEADTLIERRGGRERRLPLAGLTSIRTTPRGALLAFGPVRRLAIPGLTYGEGLRPLDNADSFAPFVAALIETAGRVAPKARLAAAAAPTLREPLLWAMALSGGGALALILFAATSGALALGLSLAARLLFVTILTGAVLPWLGRPAR